MVKILSYEVSTTRGQGQLGVRVPTLIISPLITKGTLEPTLLEHASAPATLRAMFAPTAQPLTRRDAAARTFHHLWRLDTPRTDLPNLSTYTEPPPDHPPSALTGRRSSAAPTPQTPHYIQEFVTQAEDVRKHLLTVEEPEAAHLDTARTVNDGDAVAAKFTAAAQRHREEQRATGNS